MSNVSEVVTLIERQGEELAKQFQRVDALEKALNGVLVKANRPQLFGGEERAGDAQYKTNFLRYLRSGRDVELKTMSSSVDPDGGYAIPTATDSLITKALRELSPMRQLARVIRVTTPEFNMLHSAGGTGYAWVGETSARSATDTPSLRNIAPPLGEIYANPGCTQRLLDDVSFDLESWLAEEVSEAFAAGEGDAFINGTGIVKPRGLLTYDLSTDVDGTRSENAFQYIVTGTSGAFPASNPVDKLLALVHATKPRYRQGASWLMASSTLEVIRKFKDGQGQLLWQPSLQAGQPSMLLGYPVYDDENMPAIAANSLSVAFGDFQRGYVITDRNTLTLRDPFTNKPYVHFYTTKRVGGGARDLRAIKFLKFATA